jgi:hypothetical protein
VKRLGLDDSDALSAAKRAPAAADLELLVKTPGA